MTSAHIPDDRRDRVRQAAGQRCGYCLSPQHLVLGQLEIDHLQPTACGGTDEEDNLWLACRLCNHAKSAQTECRDPITGPLVPLFNPRRQSWSEHFVWSDDGTRILGKTPIGRATIVALQTQQSDLRRRSPPLGCRWLASAGCEFWIGPIQRSRAEFAAYAEKHGFENLCRVLFNVSEFVFVD